MSYTKATLLLDDARWAIDELYSDVSNQLIIEAHSGFRSIDVSEKLNNHPLSPIYGRGRTTWNDCYVVLEQLVKDGELHRADRSVGAPYYRKAGT